MLVEMSRVVPADFSGLHGRTPQPPYNSAELKGCIDGSHNNVLQHPAPRIAARRADCDMKGKQVLLAWMGIASCRSCIPVGKPGRRSVGAVLVRTCSSQSSNR